VAKRNSGRRGRSRKQRPQPDSAAGGDAPATAQSRPPARRRERPQPQSANERPQAPWHPLPLSELLILVGAVATIVGVKRLNHGGVANAGPTLIAGVAAVAIGTVEVTLREHLSGFRAHTLLLALIPTIVFHTLAILLLSAFVTVPRWVNIPVLALDGALFAFLYKLLRARFIDARRERLYAARR
jgi:hypothetical protein